MKFPIYNTLSCTKLYWTAAVCENKDVFVKSKLQILEYLKIGNHIQIYIIIYHVSDVGVGWYRYIVHTSL